MRKELVISSVAQETRVAVIEDGELVEFLIERGRARGIAGNIYKGKVTKVLPGMQSAFVDIGLERDAFLYVSDFLEDTDEYERMVSSVEAEVFGSDESSSESPRRRSRPGRGRDRGRERFREDSKDPAPEGAADESNGGASPAEAGDEASIGEVVGRDESEQVRSDDADVGDGPDPRRFRGRGARPERGRPAPFSKEARPRGPQVLPGESLKKYRGAEPPVEAAANPEVAETGDPEPGAGETGGPTPAEESAQPAGDVGAATFDAVEDFRGPGAGSEAEGESGDKAKADDGANAPEPEVSEADSDAGPRQSRIIDRGRSGELSQRAPSRRGRRPPPEPSEKSANGLRAPMISDLLKEGQEILVQVAKEPLGKKGARITSHIALPGRYLVYMPTVDHVGVSRKISSEEERARLRRIIAENRDDLPGGFIVRTAAEGRDEKEFVQDLRFLFDTWKEIREKNEKAHAPAVIHADLGLVERVLRDQLTDEFKAIRLDSEVEYTKVLEFVSKFQPSLVHRVKLHLKDTPIFEEYGLQQEIDKALRSKVWLKSGGYIVVNQTEALVAVDVNTGKFVGKSNRLEDTIVRTNLDAVHEIVRQIRLRNLGGIIVVDFIDMEERKNRQRVMQALEEELGKDRSPSKILQFNDFGLVAITRKRTHASLERVLGAACPRCSGSGYVKSVETVCYEIQQELRRMMGQVEGNELTVRASPEVAKALKSAEFFDLADIEEEARMEIRVQADPLLAERFDIYE